MDREKNRKRVTAIVPTFNEAPRIGAVLDILTTYPDFKEIIVIDDGSSDNTANIVARYNVRYIQNKINRGKGYVMDQAVGEATSDIIFFCDADISGLTHGIIRSITAPVIEERFDMSIGMRNRKIYITHFIMKFIPLLGGERALTTELWKKIPTYYKHCFRIEAALNFYATYYGKGFSYKIYSGLSQVIKEKKYGMIKGIKERWKLYKNVLSAQWKLQCIDVPKNVAHTRYLWVSTLENAVGILIGLVIIASAYFGPEYFISTIFAEDLRTEAHTPLINFFLYLGRSLHIETIFIVGTLFFIIHVFFFVTHIYSLYRKQFRHL